MNQKLELPGYVAFGVYIDSLNLLRKYEQLHTCCYDPFTELWKEMKFSYIYCAITLPCEVLEYTEHVFNIAKSLMLDAQNSLWFRIGALFMLYGLYGKQPMRKARKIRLTTEEMEIFFNMIETFKSQGFFEASMVAFKLLILEQAFVLVVKPYSYGLYKSYRKYHDGSLVPVTPKDNSSFLTPEDITGATTSDLFDALNIINQEYEVVKALQSLKDREEFFKKFQGSQQFSIRNKLERNLKVFNESLKKVSIEEESVPSTSKPKQKYTRFLKKTRLPAFLYEQNDECDDEGL